MNSEENTNKNIVLIGMMGAGKTFMGGKLSKLLAHFSHVDIDKKIEEETNMTISEIFEVESEDYFRVLESQMIKRVSTGKNQIISIGGGAFENPENKKVLKENGVTFYLQASTKELYQRIKNETHRPVLGEGFSEKTIKELLKKREKNYMKADFVINTEKQPAYTILNDILQGYENYAK